MKKYKHKIIVIPFNFDCFVGIIALRKNRKKRWSRNRYERKLNKTTFKWESKIITENDFVNISSLFPDINNIILD